MLKLDSVTAPDRVDLSAVQPKPSHKVRPVLRYGFHELRGSLSLEGQASSIFERRGNFPRA